MERKLKHPFDAPPEATPEAKRKAPIVPEETYERNPPPNPVTKAYKAKDGFESPGDATAAAQEQSEADTKKSKKAAEEKK